MKTLTEKNVILLAASAVFSGMTALVVALLILLAGYVAILQFCAYAGVDLTEKSYFAYALRAIVYCGSIFCGLHVTIAKGWILFRQEIGDSHVMGYKRFRTATMRISDIKEKRHSTFGNLILVSDEQRIALNLMVFSDRVEAIIRCRAWGRQE